ncbi:hypothetical protein BSLG_001951 [Batrachochytrium salamandrivorans]|nr:hypothetical protein BASA83_009831 [Batrachochytrium salamandrivorans]KAJ1343509.1 hypothetical protein BSLG_001951 [Batrachochytrium salamandrivorans]
MIFTARSFVAALTVVSLPLTSANVYRRHDDGPNSQESSKSHSPSFDGGNNPHTTGTGTSTLTNSGMTGTSLPNADSVPTPAPASSPTAASTAASTATSTATDIPSSQKYGVAGPCTSDASCESDLICGRLPSQAPTSSGVCIVADGKVVGLGDGCGGFTRSAPQCGAGLSCKLGPVADAGGQCEPASPDALPDIPQQHPSVLSTSSSEVSNTATSPASSETTAGYDHDTSPSPPAQEVQLPVSSTATAGINYGVSTASSTTAYPMPASAPAGITDYGAVISAAFDSRPVAPSATMAAFLVVLMAMFI